MPDPTDTLDPGQNKLVEFRVDAALAGAGAWDGAPLELACADASILLLVLSYTRGAAGGAFDFQIFTSIYSVAALVPTGAEEWASTSQYASGVLVPGADSLGLVQREPLSYGSTGAAREGFNYGPLYLLGAVERIRVRARESGVVGNPGDLQIEGVLR